MESGGSPGSGLLGIPPTDATGKLSQRAQGSLRLPEKHRTPQVPEGGGLATLGGGLFLPHPGVSYSPGKAENLAEERTAKMGWEWLTWLTGHAGTPEPSSRGPTRAGRSLPVQGALPAPGPSASLGQGVLGSADLPGPGLRGQRPPCSPAGPSPTGPCPRPRPTLQRVRRSACKGGLFICLIKRRLLAAFGSICFTYSHVPAKLNTINTGRLKAKGRLETHRQTQEPHGAA